MTLGQVLDERASEVSQEIGDGRRWRSGGEWAQATRLGAQPGVVEWALADWGRFGIAGTVAPGALTIIPYV